MGMDHEIWHPTVLACIRKRLQEADVARLLSGAIVRQVRQLGWVSSGHFSADVSVLEAWASQNCFQSERERPDEGEPKEGGRNREVDYRGGGEAMGRLSR